MRAIEGSGKRKRVSRLESILEEDDAEEEFNVEDIDGEPSAETIAFLEATMGRTEPTIIVQRPRRRIAPNKRFKSSK